MKRIILGIAVGSILTLLVLNTDRIIMELQAAAVIVSSSEAAPQPSLQNMVRIVDVVDIATPPLPQPTGAAAPSPTPHLEPTPEFSPQFLADCALGISNNRRVSPRCPSNAVEMLGTGR